MVKHDNTKSIKRKLMISSCLLLLFALAFNAMLSLSSLNKMYTDSMVSKLQVTGSDLQRKLSKSLRFGKNIHKFVGIDTILAESQRILLDKLSATDGKFIPMDDLAVNVLVALPDKTILYSADKTLEGTPLDAPPEKDKNHSDYIRHNEEIIITFPILDFKKSLAANLHITFNEQIISRLFNKVLHHNIKIILIIVVCGSILVTLLLHLATLRISPERKFPKSRISLILITIIGLSQLIFTGLNTYQFKNYYLKINKEKTLDIVSILCRDIEFYLSKGLNLDRLARFDDMLEEIIESSPELRDITILDMNNRPLYAAPDDSVSEPAEDWPSVSTNYTIRKEILKNGVVDGFISANISKKNLFQTLRETALDSLTVLVVSILFFLELLILIFKFVEKGTTPSKEQEKIHYGIIRPAAFLFLFGVDISISFLPLHMERLYEPFMGLSKDVVMGLPISAEVTFTGIAIVAAGYWLDRRGWHEAFITGLFMVGAGSIYSWFAPNAAHLIISRTIVGTGYGFSLMAGQGFVISNTDRDNKARGLAHFFAGVYAGSICGGATGAMLAERMGYEPVFIVGAVIVVSIVGYTFFFMRNAMKKPVTKTSGGKLPVKKKNAVPFARLKLLGAFLFNRNIFSLIVFSSIPYALAVVGFLNYFSPVYLSRIGATQANIGRIYMIYGVCLIYIAPYVASFSKSSNDKLFLVLSGIFGSLGFMMFHFFEGIGAAAVAVFLLGLAGSFGVPRRSYILKFKASHKLGEGASMGIFLSTIRIGQMLGPIMFGWLIVTIGINTGITWFGFAYMALTLLFLVFVQSDKKVESIER